MEKLTFKEIPLIIDCLPLEHHVEGMSDVEKAAWYKGFAKAQSIHNRSISLVTGVYRFPTDSVSFVAKLTDRVIDLTQAEADIRKEASNG